VRPASQVPTRFGEVATDIAPRLSAPASISTSSVSAAWGSPDPKCLPGCRIGDADSPWLISALGAALTVIRTAHRVGFSSHQRVDERGQQLVQHVGVGGWTTLLCSTTRAPGVIADASGFPARTTTGRLQAQDESHETRRRHRKVALARLEKGLTRQQLADAIDKPVVWTTAALLGQHRIPPSRPRCWSRCSASTRRSCLASVPMRGGLPTAVPTDPTTYRFYEALQVYGRAHQRGHPRTVRRRDHERHHFQCRRPEETAPLRRSSRRDVRRQIPALPVDGRARLKLRLRVPSGHRTKTDSADQRTAAPGPRTLPGHQCRVLGGNDNSDHRGGWP